MKSASEDATLDVRAARAARLDAREPWERFVDWLGELRTMLHEERLAHAMGRRYFEGGVPTARKGEPAPGSELPPSERPPANSLLPGYLQPRQRGVK